MKAAIYTAYGQPEVVHVTNINKPVPKDDEVLIKVHATTVNRTDTGFRSAEYVVSRLFSGLWKPKFPVLGNEFAGVIDAIGKDVHSFAVGESVFGYNDKTFGAHAEYMTLPAAAAITTIPSNFTFKEAAPLTEGAHYALCDIRKANVQAGQNVMVYGATGAIGSAAVQLLKAIGANVTAICNTPNIALVKSLGADLVIDYLQDDFTQTSQTFDFILDAVGKSSWGACKPLLKPNGIYISTELGKHWENIYLALFTPLLGGKKVLFPIPTISKEDVIFLKQLAETGKFKPVIDSYYSLEQIVEAHRYAQSGQKVGNVIIEILR